MKREILTLLCLSTLYCFSQEMWTMQILNKDGSKHEFITDDIDGISFVKKICLGSWEDKIKWPTPDQISIDNDTSDCKSPYITAAFLPLNTGDSCYLGCSVDFKADFVPLQTYCGLACFRLDYDYLRKQGNYDRVDNGNFPFAYAGFQRIQKDNSSEFIGSILSIWETYCYKGEKIDTIKPTLIYPIGEAIFYADEGRYASHRPEYLWKPHRWYRMVFLLGTSEETGFTTIEQKVCDLEKKEWTTLCAFDLGAPNIIFKGNVIAFLENWKDETAGEIRTMELKNVRTLDANSKTWVNKDKAYLTSEKPGNYSGSCQFGADETTFWMITTGVPYCSTEQSSMIFEVKSSEVGCPLVIE